MEPVQQANLSFSIQNETSLSPHETNYLTELFQVLVKQEVEIGKVEERRGSLRASQLVDMSEQSLKTYYQGDLTKIEKLQDYMEVHSPEFWEELDRQFYTSQQRLLCTTYIVVEFLRSRNEFVAWEYNMSGAIQAMQRWHRLVKSLPPEMTKDFEEANKLLEFEIEAHHDQCSELFLRYAQNNAIESVENPSLIEQISEQCASAFTKLRENIREFQSSGSSIEKQYRPLVLSVKAFGLAYRNFKHIGSKTTEVNYLNNFVAMITANKK